MLNEATLRRDDFLPGTALRLADGQLWTIPDAQQFRPGPATPGPAGPAPPGDYEAAVRAIWEAEDETERLRAELALLICLLGRNYAFTPAEYQQVLGFTPGSLALEAATSAFRAIASDHVRSLQPRRVAEETTAGRLPWLVRLQRRIGLAPASQMT